MQNLIDDPLINVRLTDGTVDILSLPEVYASMVADRVAAFPALRCHQRHAWHAFLAQLGVIAMHRAGRTTPPDSATEWCALLRGLTPTFPSHEPWDLIVERPDQPAFMQCPAPDGLEEYRGCKHTPDDLDLLITSKNHERKASVAMRSAPDDWIFALIDLQTMAGFMGAGNYGVVRMNGGFSARPCLGFAPAEGGAGAHLVHDMRGMLSARDALIDRYAFEPDTGLALLWTEPWDGTEALELHRLDPYFLEICRRVRLQREGSGTVARLARSRCARISKVPNGDSGDFWTPVGVRDGKALSVSVAGFPYDRLAALLLASNTFILPPAMRVDPAASPRWRLIARGVAGGQGKTEGYHERTDIVFAPETVAALLGREGRDTLLALAEAQMEEIADVRTALCFAVAVAAAGGRALTPEALTERDRLHAAPYARRLDAVADASFFEVLDARFRTLTVDPPVAAQRRRAFALGLIDTAKSLLNEALAAVRCSTLLRWRAHVRARSAFWGMLRRADSQFARQTGIVPSARETDAPINGDRASLRPGCDVAGLAHDIAAVDSTMRSALRRNPLASVSTTVLVRTLMGRHAAGTANVGTVARLVQAIAILTPRGWPSRTTHDPKSTMGAALAAAGISGLRLARMLTAPRPRRPELAVLACRRLAAAGRTAFDLRPLARFVLGGDETADRQIAQEYAGADFAAAMGKREGAAGG